MRAETSPIKITSTPLISIYSVVDPFFNSYVQLERKQVERPSQIG